MQKLAFRRFALVVSIGFALLVLGCTKLMDIADGERWFEVHKDQLYKLNAKLLKHPVIERIDPGIGMEFAPNVEVFDNSTKIAYNEMEKSCIGLGVENIAVSRDGHMSSGDLISIRYTLDSRGIVTSGGGYLSINYIPDASFAKLLKGPHSVIKPLNAEHWYIVQLTK